MSSTNAMDTEPLMTPTEIAERLRLHRNTVTKLIKSGVFRDAFMAGTRWRVPRKSVEEYMHQNTQQ